MKCCHQIVDRACWNCANNRTQFWAAFVLTSRGKKAKRKKKHTGTHTYTLAGTHTTHKDTLAAEWDGYGALPALPQWITQLESLPSNELKLSAWVVEEPLKLSVSLLFEPASAAALALSSSSFISSTQVVRLKWFLVVQLLFHTGLQQFNTLQGHTFHVDPFEKLENGQ